MDDGLLLDELLAQAMEMGASDLHLTVELPPRVRIRGELISLGLAPLSRDTVTALIETFLSAERREILEQQGQIDFAHSLPGVGRFRANIYRQRGSLAAALRVIPWQVPTLEEIGAPPTLATLATEPDGLIVMTGTAGSGKSTTLAAMVDRINRERSCHIVTLEDPIEYLHRHQRSMVNQREIGTDVSNFPRALRAVLRQDPDVIMISEMRDLETIAVALTAAETGCLVLAALHTPDVVQAVVRLVDVFPPHQRELVRVQLAGLLRGIASQVLVPRVSGRGSVAAFEVLVSTPAVKSLIREGKLGQLPSALQTGAKYGMCTREESLRRLAETGEIAYGNH